MFVIAKPDVFKSPNSDTYVIFGEAKIEDFGAQAQAQAAQNFVPSAQSLATAEPSAAAVEEEEEEADASGLKESDIELVVSQAGVSRAKAINALRAKDSDIVSAIMELTMT
jgi:nascent polypeptide-associated complex subunit alpha